MREAVIAFFDENERWLSDVLVQGREQDALTFAGPAQEAAQSVLGTLEGAMLVARPYGDVARFDTAARQLLGGLAA